jgi:ParB family transcriptional regulator, chromosome partitioning protein
MSDRATKPKSRLGRGLSSLISLSAPDDAPTQHPAVPAPGNGSATGSAAGSATASATPSVPSDTSATPPPGVRVAEIPLASIVPNPHQPRRQFNEASLNELAASLRSTGMIQPVIVRPGESGAYELIAGERRWRAARLADLPTVPALIRDVDTVTQAQMALIENIQREDLNPLDRASAYHALIHQLGLSQGELAGRLGEDRTTVNHFLRLLELPEPVQSLIRDGRLTLGHAKLLAGVTTPAEQQRLADLVATQNLSVRNLERLVGTTPPPTPVKREQLASGSEAHLKDLERSLSRQLNLRVQLRSGKKKGRGKLILHFTSLDQFDDLMGRLGVATE